jgi:adenylate cyclase
VGAGIVVVANFGVNEILSISGTLTVILAGLATCSLQYLVVERLMRPLIALVLDGGPPPHTEIPGVATRIAMAWILTTGGPVLGIIALGTLDFAGAAFNPARVITASFALAVAAVVVGFSSIAIVAISVAHPLVSMREALAQVEMGNLDARVAVDDGSEVGRLAAGFNRMVTGLAERERLRDALGAFVDPTLADRVLREGIDLAGEIIEVSLLFMDVRGFTEFSESADANTIVTALNDLYGDVVPIILSHGGHANKFVGDGLLAVFGAPERLPDHADRAVAAGLEIVATVRSRAGSNLRVGIGINSGPVVVGTVGGGGRLDFTVIGDPVNTAARVEAATRVTGDDLLITDATRRLLTTERAAWLERPAVPMKGKRSPVLLWADSARP